MKTQVKNLKPGDVFDTDATVMVSREGYSGNKARDWAGKDVSPLVLKEFERVTDYAKCKMRNIASDLWVFVPLDAKVEVKG